MPKQQPREIVASEGMDAKTANAALRKVCGLGFGASYLKEISPDVIRVVVKSHREIEPPAFLPELFHADKGS